METDALFSGFQLLPETKVCVVIPVKNEEVHIQETLKCFLNQKNIDHSPYNFKRFEVLILANNCTDGSVNLIRSFQKTYPQIHLHLREIKLRPEKANIGYVRRKLMNQACARLKDNVGGIIMTTDGDTRVSHDWIAQNEAEICNGADAVGGRILLCEKEWMNLDSITRAMHLKDEEYLMLRAALESEILELNHDPNPRHHQHFNGSFAITSFFYEKCGGIPHVDHLEDCALFERLQQCDAKIKHSNSVRVHTSARCTGRTDIGLSWQLNCWKNLGQKGLVNFKVESGNSVVQRLKFKKYLSEVWQKRTSDGFNYYGEMEKIIPLLTNMEAHYHSLNKCKYFGEWYAEVASACATSWRMRYPNENIDDAIKYLKNELSNYAPELISQTSIR